jgi:hypothetical protein
VARGTSVAFELKLLIEPFCTYVIFPCLQDKDKEVKVHASD